MYRKISNESNRQLLAQNEKLHYINVELQKQNMRISQDPLISASFNFLDIKSVKNVADNTDYDVKIEFATDSFTDTPLREVEVESLEILISHNIMGQNTIDAFCIDEQDSCLAYHEPPNIYCMLVFILESRYEILLLGTLHRM